MTGEVFINGLDAYTEWGLNLEDGALSTLLTPSPLKPMIESDSRLENGKVMVGTPRIASREMSLPFHITAKSKTDFFAKYEAFCNDVLAHGNFTLRTKYQQGVKYRLVYQSCSQFTQYMTEMGKFSLKVIEPDPTDRAV